MRRRPRRALPDLRRAARRGAEPHGLTRAIRPRVGSRLTTRPSFGPSTSFSPRSSRSGRDVLALEASSPRRFRPCARQVMVTSDAPCRARPGAHPGVRPRREPESLSPPPRQGQRLPRFRAPSIDSMLPGASPHPGLREPATNSAALPPTERLRAVGSPSWLAPLGLDPSPVTDSSPVGDVGPDASNRLLQTKRSASTTTVVQALLDPAPGLPGAQPRS